MQNSRLFDWINLAAAIGVLVGLIFVAYELRQNNLHARAETVREFWTEYNEGLMFELQSDLIPLIMQSFNDPLSLTDEEIYKLDKYLLLKMQQQISVAMLRSNYGLAEGTTDEQAADIVGDFLSSGFARGWFAANQNWIRLWHAELVEAINRELTRAPMENEFKWPSEIRSSVKKVLDSE